MEQNAHDGNDSHHHLIHRSRFLKRTLIPVRLRKNLLVLMLIQVDDSSEYCVDVHADNATFRICVIALLQILAVFCLPDRTSYIYRVVIKHVASIDLEALAAFCRGERQSTQAEAMMLTALMSVNVLLRDDVSPFFRHIRSWSISRIGFFLAKLTHSLCLRFMGLNTAHEAIHSCRFCRYSILRYGWGCSHSRWRCRRKRFHAVS